MIDTAALIAKTDLATLIGGTVKLRRVGAGRLIGRCPFHNEKTGSFWVYTASGTETGHYHCFGCGAHGDAIRWLTTYDRLTFKEACAELTRMAGLDRAPRGTAKPKPPKEPPQHALQGPWRADLPPTAPAVIVSGAGFIPAAQARFPNSQVYAGTAACYLRPLRGRDVLIWMGWIGDRTELHHRALFGWAEYLAAKCREDVRRLRVGFHCHVAGAVIYDPATGRAWFNGAIAAPADQTNPQPTEEVTRMSGGTAAGGAEALTGGRETADAAA